MAGGEEAYSFVAYLGPLTNRPHISFETEGAGCSDDITCYIYETIELAPMDYRDGAGFSPEQASSRSPSAKRRNVLGKSHEG